MKLIEPLWLKCTLTLTIYSTSWTVTLVHKSNHKVRTGTSQTNRKGRYITAPKSVPKTRIIVWQYSSWFILFCNLPYFVPPTVPRSPAASLSQWSSYPVIVEGRKRMIILQISAQLLSTMAETRWT